MSPEDIKKAREIIAAMGKCIQTDCYNAARTGWTAALDYIEMLNKEGAALLSDFHVVSRENKELRKNLDADIAGFVEAKRLYDELLDETIKLRAIAEAGLEMFVDGMDTRKMRVFVDRLLAWRDEK